MEGQQAGGLSVTHGKHIASVGSIAFAIRRISEESLEINGKEVPFDFKPLHEGSFSLILGGSSYVVGYSRSNNSSDAVQQDTDGLLGKSVDVGIKSKTYSVLVDDERSILFKRFATKAQVGTEVQVIKAPMPGLISRIETTVGEEVRKGQGLLVLEAMKMENEIRSSVRGKVHSVDVKKRMVVEKGQPLLKIITS